MESIRDGLMTLFLNNGFYLFLSIFLFIRAEFCRPECLKNIERVDYWQKFANDAAEYHYNFRFEYFSGLMINALYSLTTTLIPKVIYITVSDPHRYDSNLYKFVIFIITLIICSIWMHYEHRYVNKKDIGLNKMIPIKLLIVIITFVL